MADGNWRTIRRLERDDALEVLDELVREREIGCENLAELLDQHKREGNRLSADNVYWKLQSAKRMAEALALAVKFLRDEC